VSQEEQARLDKQDYLSIFINSILEGGRKQLTRENAKVIFDACLRSYRERLQQKERLLNARIEKETKSLKKRQAVLNKNQDMETEEEQEHQKFIAETSFRKKILEQRLTRVSNHQPSFEWRTHFLSLSSIKLLPK
jgi:hypothetical protein